VAVVVLLALLALLLFQLFRPGVDRDRAEPSTVAAVPVILDKSIAVLPFDNLNRDAENTSFADGMQDEILTSLAKISDLRVISRSSVMQYADATKRNLPEIARALRVAHVLEASVQRTADRIRVNARLIDARNDVNVWAQTYDRDLTTLFAVQAKSPKASRPSCAPKSAGRASLNRRTADGRSRGVRSLHARQDIGAHRKSCGVQGPAVAGDRLPEPGCRT
jgi:TolB-like protein